MFCGVYKLFWGVTLVGGSLLLNIEALNYTGPNRKLQNYIMSSCEVSHQKIHPSAAAPLPLSNRCVFTVCYYLTSLLTLSEYRWKLVLGGFTSSGNPILHRLSHTGEITQNKNCFHVNRICFGRSDSLTVDMNQPITAYHHPPSLLLPPPCENHRRVQVLLVPSHSLLIYFLSKRDYSSLFSPWNKQKCGFV